MREDGSSAPRNQMASAGSSRQRNASPENPYLLAHPK
jgi:hypothetical protein